MQTKTVKPIYANLTQEQRNTCVAAAIQSGEKLNDWAADVLLKSAETQLKLTAISKYISHSDEQGYESVMMDIEQAKWLLRVAENVRK